MHLRLLSQQAINNNENLFFLAVKYLTGFFILFPGFSIRKWILSMQSKHSFKTSNRLFGQNLALILSNDWWSVEKEHLQVLLIESITFQMCKKITFFLIGQHKTLTLQILAPPKRDSIMLSMYVQDSRSSQGCLHFCLS